MYLDIVAIRHCKAVSEAMKQNLDRREFIMSSSLAALGGALLFRRINSAGATIVGSTDQDLLPRSVGKFNRIDDRNIIAPQLEEMDKVYTSVTTAEFVTTDAAPIMMLVAYDSNERRDSLKGHRPEGCYKGAGFQLGSREVFTLAMGQKKIPATFLTATRGDRKEHILYWMRLSNSFYSDGISQMAALLEHSLSAAPQDSALVRFSTIRDESDVARVELITFAQAFSKRLSSRQQEIIFGPES
jgi:EpsI family protein